MLEQVITYASRERQVCKNGVRRTKGGRFLVLAEPAGNAKIRINFKSVLGPGDGINTVAADVDDVTWTATIGGDSLDVNLSSIPYTSGVWKDYGRHSGSDDPNVWLKVTFISGNIIIVPIIARNYNLPLEISPTTISSSATTRTWATMMPLVGADVAFSPTAVDDEVREILSRPMEVQPLVGADDTFSPDSRNVNMEAFTYEEQDIPDATPVADTPSSGVFVSVSGADVPVTGS